MPLFRMLSVTRHKRTTSLLFFSRSLKCNHIRNAPFKTEEDLDHQKPDKTVLNDDIFGVESTEGAICFEDSQTRLEKFRKPVEKPAGETFVRTSFGAIRRDQDNENYDSVRRSKLKIPDMYDVVYPSSKYKAQRRNEKTKNVAAFKDFDADLENFPSKNILANEFSSQKLKRKEKENLIDDFYLKEKGIDQEQDMNHVFNKNEQKGTQHSEELIKPKSTNQLQSASNEISYIDSVYFDEYAVEKGNVEQGQQNISSEGSYIDSLYFDEPSAENNVLEKVSPVVQEHKLEKSSTNVPNSEIPLSKYTTSLHRSTKAEENISEIDEKYFGSDVSFDSLHNASNNVPPEQNISEIDEQYFGSHVDFESVADHGLPSEDSSKRTFSKKKSNRKSHPLADLPLNSNKTSSRTASVVSNGVSNPTVSLKKSGIEIRRTEPKVWEEIPKEEKVIAQNEDTESEEKIETATTRTAFDFVANLRKERGTKTLPDGSLTTSAGIKQDSKGFRILSNQVPDLTKLTQDELITELKSRVLYSDDDVVILDKPYNLVMHEAKTTNTPTLESVLDGLSSVIDGGSSDSKLITVHRLDKTTTGCLLLARNEKVASYLKALFAQRQVKKTYWIVTIRTPENQQGIIDMPITEGTINSKTRMVLRPILSSDVPYKSHCRSGKQAVTKYSVIATSGSAALIEAEATTGVKHQIRVHFGFGLNCPILGDHKYSHLDKLAPQKLPSDILQRLHVRQSKVRYVPMHIHARSIVIPNYYENRDLFAYAPLPEHFRKNLQTLKFRKK